MPPPRGGEQNDIQAKVIRVYWEDNLKMGGKIQLRTVSWIVNGKATAPRIELREQFTNESGQERMGKAKGFSLAHIRIMQDQWDQVVADLSGQTRPAAPPPSAPAPAATKPDPF